MNKDGIYACRLPEYACHVNVYMTCLHSTLIQLIDLIGIRNEHTAHNCDAIMSAMASQITNNSIVY